MILGVPKEMKSQEYRVALTPGAVAQLVRAGHQVLVEKGAGIGSGFSDQAYRDHAATIVNDAKGLWQKAEIILKVKEPLPKEFSYFRPGLILFTFLHLANSPVLTKALLKKQVNAIGYETIVGGDGGLVLLKPMSEIAGKLAVLVGGDYLRTDAGNKGILIANIEGARRAKVTILGAGNVGSAALEVAASLGAEVTLLDKDEHKLKQLALRYPSPQVKTSLIHQINFEKLLEATDLLIGAVLIPGARAPRLVTRKMVAYMQTGSVIVDVSVDQGACIETIKPTTLARPSFEYKGVIHYGVTNIPSLAARTATESLVAKTLPYIEKLAQGGLEALKQDRGFELGLQVSAGKIVHSVVAEALRIK